MGALLALIPSKDWLYVAAISALLIGFGAYTIHERRAGAAHEAAALKASSLILEKQTADKTAELKAKADMAERAYDKEHALILNQPIDSVRLCHSTNSSRIVPKAGAVVAGNANSGSAAVGVQQVPSGDSSVAGPDIGPMLDALAAGADQVSAELREYQSR